MQTVGGTAQNLSVAVGESSCEEEALLTKLDLFSVAQTGRSKAYLVLESPLSTVIVKKGRPKS